MLNKLNQIFQLLKNMGPRYLAFRVYFEFRKRSGLLKKSFPINPIKREFISLEEWRNSNHFFINARDETSSIGYPFEVDVERNENQKEGKIIFFSNILYSLGDNYDWVTNPDTGFQYDISKHWIDINDFDLKSGDIKYVWEKSRFSFIYLTIRSDIKQNTDSSKYIFDEILSWIKQNPINQGPNYKCSQEISLRVLNWYYALQFYRNSKHLTPELFEEIIHVIYWQLKHVYSNINFSRIAVRNNHAITETLTLYLAGLIFPYFPESLKWKEKGKTWFEQEVKYQVYKDGTYLQFSMNYHRVLIQLLNLGFVVAQHYNEKFSPIIYERAYRSLNFLYQSQDIESGMLPNYGANDGALFFPFSNCEYRDFRPCLNTLHFLLTNKFLYSNGPWNEELFMLNSKSATLDLNFNVVNKKLGWSSFEIGGYYILNEKSGITFIRCGNHKDRPSQADNLHVDIWYNSSNVLRDSGSYKYNSSKSDIEYFFGTESHNTAMIDDFNQMKKGSRFIWYNWSNSLGVKTYENNDEYIFEGEISAFTFLNKNISHKRKLIKSKTKQIWQIEDSIKNKNPESVFRQLWHPNPDFLSNIEFSNSNAQIKSKQGYFSSKYGQKEENAYLSIETKNSFLSTTITLNENITTASILP